MGADRFDERQLFACEDVEFVVTSAGELVLQVRSEDAEPLVLEKARIDDELAPKE
ncbi:MAG: hypothetical protein KatS3mg102_0905 [Planctomycetota bacterium]|nr:MAG: hypothetical protein KatS3mg102_0905 [Planctomycetota bacterium]